MLRDENGVFLRDLHHPNQVKRGRSEALISLPSMKTSLHGKLVYNGDRAFANLVYEDREAK